jgi:hypothetical protein
MDAEVPLARLWQLSDGTACMLVKDRSALNWRLRVVRGDTTLQTEQFDSPIVAMDQAKLWRTWYEPEIEASG